MVRWILEIDSDFNVPVKVEIEDSEYSGSAIQVKGGDDAVIYETGRPNSNELRDIAVSQIILKLAGGKGDYEDLFTRDFSRFKINLYVDGDLENQFLFLPDTFDVPDVQNADFGNFAVSLRGTNFKAFDRIKVFDILDEDVTMSKLDAIHQIVNHFFDVDVVDGTIEYPEGANTNTSALTQIDFNTSRFENETAFEALEWLITEPHQIRISNGLAFVFPVKEASFTGYRYNGTSVSSGVTYNDNFTAIRRGRVLETSRNKSEKYDSVLRNYEPGEAPNIVPNGDLDDLENFTYTTAPIGNLRFGLPNGWTIAQGDTPWLIRNTGIESDPYRGEINVGNSIYEALTDIEIIENQNLRVNVNVEFNSSRDVVWCLPVKVKVGDYVAQIDYGISGSRLTGTGELSWELESQVDNPFLFVLGNSGRIINFSQQLPPLPATGTASFQVASPLPFLNIVTPYNQNVDADDRAFLYNFALDAVDEEGDIILRSETEAGEAGDPYEYTEQFGDGFTSVNPGALFFNGQQTLNWSVKGYSGAGSLADVQTSYLLSELSRDRDRISGNVDTFDTIALIEGKRVNYISTNFRKGNSKIELVEIVPHDLDAVPEERRERGGGGNKIGERWDNEDFFPFSRISAIGVLREDIEEEERTSVKAEFDIVARKGIEYWIVNEAELSRTDRQAGIYPINPVTTDSGGDPLFPGDAGYDTGTKEYGPGLLEALPIQSTLINAPEGSLIYKAPGQTETEQNVGEELDREFDERIETVNTELTELNDVKLPALQDQLDQLNDVEIPNLNDAIDDLNNVQIPALESELATLDGYIENPSTIPSSYNFFDGIVTNQAFIDSFVANDGYVGNLVTKNTYADTFTGNTALMEKVVASTGFFNEFTANAGFIDDLIAGNLWADKITAIEINVDDLGANNAFIDRLMAQTLIMRSNGIITNTNEDFGINSDGIFIKSTTFSMRERSFNVVNESNISQIFGRVWSSGSSFNIEGVGRPINLITDNGPIRMQSIAGVDMTVLSANPGNTAGRIYYNDSANEMRYYNGTSWISF